MNIVKTVLLLFWTLSMICLVTAPIEGDRAFILAIIVTLFYIILSKYVQAWEKDK